LKGRAKEQRQEVKRIMVSGSLQLNGRKRESS
jgi:hypothetical protein